jgi:hypothetical protein
MNFRMLIALVAGVSFAVGCGGAPAGPNGEAQPPAEPATSSSPGNVVKASAATTAALGVVEWKLGMTAEAVSQILGYDAGGTVRAEIGYWKKPDASGGWG